VVNIFGENLYSFLMTRFSLENLEVALKIFTDFIMNLASVFYIP